MTPLPCWLSGRRKWVIGQHKPWHATNNSAYSGPFNRGKMAGISPVELFVIDNKFNMIGKLCLVTGGTSGIGQTTARELARMGADVVITARTPEKLSRSIEILRSQTGSSKVSGLVADLSSQAEVRSLAAKFRANYPHLHVLVNNAGAIYFRRYMSVDGIEMNFAGNHLAYFLLTNLLLDLIIESAPARIINVSSSSHKGQVIDFDDLECQQDYQFMVAYGRSKLANVLFTYELARRLEGRKVSVNALHPGLVGTNIAGNNGWLLRFFLPLWRVWAMSSDEWAETSIYLASSPDVEGVSGKYFYQKEAIPSSPYSGDRSVAKRLWDVSAQMTGLEPDLLLDSAVPGQAYNAVINQDHDHQPGQGHQAG
jgi:NAD(P)-dependent dehydrogenase (short-subunit alcohol dehydrogenase family)